MRTDITGVVLAGGRSRRFGSNKALARLDRRGMVIERIVGVLAGCFKKSLILCKEDKPYRFLASPRVSIYKDQSPEFHPLNGFLSALSFAPTDKIFLCACDMPFIDKNLINFVCQESGQMDATILAWQGKAQPFFGVYSKSCLEKMGGENFIKNPRNGFLSVLEKVQTRIIHPSEFIDVTQNGLPFFDIDTKFDFGRARTIMDQKDERKSALSKRGRSRGRGRFVRIPC